MKDFQKIKCRRQCVATHYRRAVRAVRSGRIVGTFFYLFLFPTQNPKNFQYNDIMVNEMTPKIIVIQNQ
ncbi:hypothetical protein TPY_2109 [Sulfobacillus acidophilus TPY]|nr:hypothetical protein TPY_2109 [Sulfobacillus acidophilus TPY]